MPMPPGRDNYNMPPGGGYGPPQQGVMAYNQPRPPMMGYQGGPPPQYQSPNYGGRREEPYRQDPYRRPQLSARSRLGDRPQGRSNYSRPNDRQVGLSRSRESRSIIEYRDLDAPDDVDIF
ncbi:serrate RNA effector molecule homolog isoform X2 [Lingula anatina]|uniref:Serrate RNA effector molecule homolog isoform X2 n=1 Tax=Lingula anatina TaxID=7574 RepID=A0A1S3HHI1_LINAN|nr:serrate RNA effector molecule homolog isoform X2 [Lingula anatina]|eukprot:XP_013385482.1 serrate RNA effector molecule homolog isoform X2 [Lingula anatina]